MIGRPGPQREGADKGTKVGGTRWELSMTVATLACTTPPPHPPPPPPPACRPPPPPRACILDRKFAQRASRWVERRLPQLLRHHLSQTLWGGEVCVCVWGGGGGGGGQAGAER